MTVGGGVDCWKIVELCFSLCIVGKCGNRFLTCIERLRDGGEEFLRRFNFCQFYGDCLKLSNPLGVRYYQWNMSSSESIHLGNRFSKVSHLHSELDRILKRSLIYAPFLSPIITFVVPPRDRSFDQSQPQKRKDKIRNNHQQMYSSTRLQR